MTSPYAWSWNTAASADGTHSLTSKAWDAAGNFGTSAAVTVTVNNSGINIGNYKLVQANATLNYSIPAGTVIPSKGYVIVARNATKAQFESFWGVTLGTNVVYVNSGDSMPQINGDENYTLSNASGNKLDGRTINMAASGGQSIRRLNGCGSPSKASSWTRAASSTGNPGAGAPAPCNKGVYISEFSDALGTGNFIYEFIELHNDK